MVLVYKYIAPFELVDHERAPRVMCVVNAWEPGKLCRLETESGRAFQLLDCSPCTFSTPQKTLHARGLHQLEMAVTAALVRSGLHWQIALISSKTSRPDMSIFLRQEPSL